MSSPRRSSAAACCCCCCCCCSCVSEAMLVPVAGGKGLCVCVSVCVMLTGAGTSPTWCGDVLRVPRCVTPKGSVTTV
jgi:hypothetical protein